MHSDNEKKSHERFLLEQFLECQGLARTSICEGESPDFVVVLDERVVGIEVTELFREHKFQPNSPVKPSAPLQAVESAANKIVLKAQELYSAADNPHLRVGIWLSDQIPLGKREGDQISQFIANQIQKMICQGSDALEWTSRDDGEERNPLSEWASQICAHKVPSDLVSHALWTAEGAGLAAPLDAARMQNTIDNKAGKLASYRKRVEENWLLIVVDRIRHSQALSLATDFNPDVISSPFAETFYFDLVHREVLRFENRPLR